MEVRQASNAKDVKYYTTERLREEFHIANLFTKDNIKMVKTRFLNMKMHANLMLILL